MRCAWLATATDADLTSSRVVRIVRLPVTLSFFPGPVMRAELETHQLMRDSDLIERRALCHKTESLVEGQSVRLRVQVDRLQSPARRFVDEPSKYPTAHANSPVGGQYCDAANLTEGFQPARANCVTVRRACQGVNADRVRGIPFFMFGTTLLL